MLVTTLAIAGCGSSSSSVSRSPRSSGEAVRIAIKNFAFSPMAAHVTVGQTVIWTNYDTVPHNVVFVGAPKLTPSPPRMGTGARFSIRLTQAGTVHYYCTIHPWMTGTIVVSP